MRTATWLLLRALAERADLFAVAPGPVDVPPGVRLLPTGGPVRPSRWRRSRALRRALVRCDLFHSPVTAFPRGLPIPVTVTVHELPFVENFRLEGWRRALAQWVWTSRAMSESAAMVVPSEATLRQLCLAHPAARRRAVLIPHPAPPAPPGEALEGGYWLFVGRLDRRKAVEAFLGGAALLEGEVRLAGPQERKARRRIEEEARRIGILPRLRFLGVVDDAALDRLYRGARAVALVSVSEGFGFPVLEALARGVPVVVARGTGAAEVGGEAAIIVDPVSPASVAGGLRLASSEEHRRRVALEGPARAATFTLARTADAYEEVFRRALGR